MGTSNFVKIFISKLLKIFNDIINVTSRKLKAFVQSHLDARFETPEITVTVPNYRVEITYFFKKSNLSFLKFFEKITNKVVSQKLQGFEQSYLEAKFKTPESTLTGKIHKPESSLTAPQYRDRIFEFCEEFLVQVL